MGGHAHVPSLGRMQKRARLLQVPCVCLGQIRQTGARGLPVDAGSGMGSVPNAAAMGATRPYETASAVRSALGKASPALVSAKSSGAVGSLLRRDLPSKYAPC